MLDKGWTTIGFGQWDVPKLAYTIFGVNCCFIYPYLCNYWFICVHHFCHFTLNSFFKCQSSLYVSSFSVGINLLTLSIEMTQGQLPTVLLHDGRNLGRNNWLSCTLLTTFSGFSLLYM